jgi:hypothetical protein
LSGSAACIACSASISHQRRNLVLDVLAPRAIVLGLEVRNERLEGLAAVADEVDLHRIADPDHAPVDVDLDTAGLALLGEPLRVGKARADHQQRVAVHDHLVARLGPEQADRPGDEGQVVGQGRPSVERLGHPTAEDVGDLPDLLRRPHGALADQHGDPVAVVQDLGRPAQVLLGGNHARRREAAARVGRSVHAWRL